MGGRRDEVAWMIFDHFVQWKMDAAKMILFDVSKGGHFPLDHAFLDVLVAHNRTPKCNQDVSLSSKSVDLFHQSLSREVFLLGCLPLVVGAFWRFRPVQELSISFGGLADCLSAVAAGQKKQTGSTAQPLLMLHSGNLT